MAPERVRPKVGLLGLTLEFYEGAAPHLREGREAWVRREVLPALEPVADVTFGGAAYTREDVAARVAECEQAGCDALLVILLTYSPSQIALPELKATDLPVIVWNTQELYGIGKDFTGAEMTDNHGVHGTQDLANVLLREGVDFAYVTSHLQDEDVLAELTDFFAAATAVRGLKKAKLGILGYPFPGMGDFALDTTHMVGTLGCEWTTMPMAEYILRAAEAPEDAVRNLVAEYRDAYDMSAEATEEELDATARVEIALRGMVEERGLDGFTYQFLAFGEDKRALTLPFVGASRLMGEGLGFGGEGDLIAAAGSALLNRLQPPASFTEMFTVDYGGNSVLLSHMGEANVAMACEDRKVPLAVRPKKITPTRERQLALVTTFRSGPATLCALTIGPGRDWRLIAAAGEVLDFGPLDSMQVPHSKFAPEGDVRDFLTGYARAGGPHHCALCFGDARRRIRMAADLSGADYREV